MKYTLKAIALTIAGCLTTIATPSFAQFPTTQTGFSCDTTSEVPTTVYMNQQGQPEPWIKWVSDHFSGSGWTPNSRCQEVSSRLETYRRNKLLRYVTLGTVNNQSVICVASQNQGPCEGIIYTLKPGQDGVKALNNLFAWRQGEQGLESNYESVTAIPYIDVGSRLDETITTPPVIERQTPVTPPTIEYQSPSSNRQL